LPITRRYGNDRARALVAKAEDAYDFLRACALKPVRYEKLARETEELSRSIGLEADVVPKSEVRNEIGTDLYLAAASRTVAPGCIPPNTTRG
jgi:hypothetical protein